MSTDLAKPDGRAGYSVLNWAAIARTAVAAGTLGAEPNTQTYPLNKLDFIGKSHVSEAMQVLTNYNFHVVPFNKIGEVVLAYRLQEWRECLAANTQSTADRMTALAELARRGDATIPQILASEFRAGSRDLNWLSALVTAAEQTQFTDAGERAVVKAGLRKTVDRIYASKDIKWERTAWAVVRTYASMLAPSEIESLSPLLDVQGGIDTRQVTLQMIQNVFAAGPPGNLLPLTALRDRVYDIAVAGMSLPSIRPGNSASLTMNALATMAALGDCRLEECAKTARANLPAWFAELTQEVLEAVTEFWPKDHPATHAVTRSRTILEPAS